MNPTARSARTARQIRHDLAVLAAARAGDVDEVDVGDVDFAWVGSACRLVDVEVALVEHDGRVCVLDVDILVGDVVDESVADVRACPGLEARAVLPVEERHVFDPGVGDVVLYAGVLADGAHGHAVGAVAPQVLNEDIGRVGLGGEAVVANVDAGVCYGETVNVERVETVGVLGQRRDVRGYGVDVDVIEDDVLGAHHEGCPAWGVFEVEAADFDVGCVVGEEEDGSVVFVVWVKNLGT